MEDLKKEEVLIFENLNYRHQRLLEKLSESESRLHNSTTLLGGVYYLKESKESDSEIKQNHLSNYNNQLDYFEGTLSYIFNHIERLENLLVRK